MMLRSDKNDPLYDDDYAWLDDSELGIAPVDPGTTEGDHAKPLEVNSAADINKWCVRECERMVMSMPGETGRLVLRDFSRRRYNIPSSDPNYPRRK